MLLVILMVNVLRVRLWILNNLQKNKKKKDLQRKKVINYMSNGKVTITILTVG